MDVHCGILGGCAGGSIRGCYGNKLVHRVNIGNLLAAILTAAFSLLVTMVQLSRQSALMGMLFLFLVIWPLSAMPAGDASVPSGSSRSCDASMKASNHSPGCCSIAPLRPDSPLVVPVAYARSVEAIAVPSGARSIAFNAVVPTSTLNTQVSIEEAEEAKAESLVILRRAMRPRGTGRLALAGGEHIARRRRSS